MKLLRRILVAVVGGSVLLIGIAMIVLPGPAIVVIPAGLAILAIEFAWARHWLNHTKDFIARTPIKAGFRETLRHWAAFFSHRPRATPPALQQATPRS